MTTPRSFLDNCKPLPPHMHIGSSGLERLVGEKAEDIKAHFAQHGFAKAVLCLDGSINAAVACALAVRALGQENVIGLRLPYGREDDGSGPVSNDLIEALKIPPRNDRFAGLGCLDDIPAKHQRAQQLGLIARLEEALVIGSMSLTEYKLGLYVRGGDDITDIEPIRDLLQTEVYMIGRHLGLPESVLLRSTRNDFGTDCVTADVALYFAVLWSPEEAMERIQDLEGLDHRPCEFDLGQVQAVIAKMEATERQRKAPHVLKHRHKW